MTETGYPDEKKAKVGPQESDVIGWHNMYWPGGQLKICFRPGGKFFCKDEEHQLDATWSIVDGDVLIDWKDRGRFALTPTEGKNMEGYCLHMPDEKKWRKTLYFGAMSPLESLLCGDGEGSEWEVETPDGKVLVEFRCDGLNHFVGLLHPGDAHWNIDKKGKTVIIDHGKHGKYHLEVDVKKKTMDGYHQPVIGEDDHGHKYDDDAEDKPECERSAVFKRNIFQPTALVHSDDGEEGGHGHSHGHGHAHGHDGHGHEHGAGHGDGHDHGGGIISLGNVTLGNEKFMVDRDNQVDKGFETEFGFERLGPGTATSFKVWLQDGAGNKLCDPVEGEAHDNHLHFNVMPKSGDAESFAISCDNQVAMISVHPGAAPTQGGIMSVLEDGDGKHVGFIELKLHDDAGDLELWMCEDGAMSKPLDISADTTITVTFATHGDKSVQLNVRDNDTNPDEDGHENMRDGKTNYFIFPGESDQDPEFLVGEKFRSTTTVTFTAEGKSYKAPEFVLVPHM